MFSTYMFLKLVHIMQPVFFLDMNVCLKIYIYLFKDIFIIYNLKSLKNAQRCTSEYLMKLNLFSSD